MAIRMPSHTALVLALYALSILGIGAALAAEPPAAAPAQSAPSRQMREQMAKLHEQMAACLRSDKSIAECRQQMMASCRAMAPSNGCSMMGMGMGSGMHMGAGGGMGRGRGTQSSSPRHAEPR